MAANAPGINYGWPITEASACYPNGDQCDMTGQTLPVLEYDHSTGACAITGGYVYRGSAMPELQGRYLYSDYCAGFLRSFRYAGGQAIEKIDWNVANVGRIISFGEDANHEPYVVTGGGKIYRIVRQ